jgi:tetratricopeptide (TPR) repeat protein
MPRAKRRRRGRRPLWTIAALLVAGITGTAVCIVWRLRAEPPPPPVVELRGIDPAVQQAVEAARAAVLDSPRSAAAWGRLGMVLLSHGLSSNASRACFAQAEALDSRDARWPYFQAGSLLTTDPEAALVKLRRAADLCDRNPQSPDLPRLQLGEQLLDQGHPQEAAEQFQRALQLHAGNARAYLGLARIAEQRGELSDSIAYLDRCVKDPRTRKAAHSLLARIYERRGDKQAAEGELRQAQALPNDAPWPDPFQMEISQLRVGKRVELERADRLLHQNQPAQAVLLLKEVVRKYPDEAWAWEMLGRAYLSRQQLPEAERALGKAAELKPDMPEAQFYLGVALILQKEPQAAADCFQKATQLKPSYAEAYYNLGHSRKELGDEAGAKAAFRAAIGCKPDYSPAHYNLACLLLNKGRKDEALVHLRHAVEFDPTNKAAKQLLEQVQK